MKKFQPTLLGLAVVCLSGLAQGAITPQAGLWEQATLLSPDGKNWHPGVRNRGCLSKAQASQWETQVRQQIAAASCTVDSLSVGNGRIVGVISCTSINQPVVKIDGQYTDSTYTVDLASAGVVDMTPAGGSARTPVKAFAKWTGRLLGPCDD